MRVAIYARVSLPTKERDKETQELKFKQEVDNQLQPLRKYIETREWINIGEYVDRATGKNDAREMFKALFVDAAKHCFDHVLFWSLDRFSREGAFETMRHLRALTDYGVTYKSYTEQYLDSQGPFAEAILSIIACVAKQERVRLHERTMAGLERAWAKGKKSGRRRIVRNESKIIEDSNAGMSLNQLAKKYGLSRTTIARIRRLGKAIVKVATGEKEKDVNKIV